MIRSKKILRHAKGQPCLLRLPGCACQSETTVFAHLNGGAFGKGMGIKAHDFAGFFAGFECHRRYDLHETGLDDGELNSLLLSAVIRTWEILINDGVIIVQQDLEKLLMEHPVKGRKPNKDRKPIVSRGFDKTRKKKMDGSVASR